jgi:hypothetical protein
MRAEEKNPPSVFESTDVTNIVGIHPSYLNKFIEREQYGIEASVRAGRGRGRPRLFSEEDVFGVALVWWLFESGLRSLTIQYVLNQICGGRLDSSANDAARIVLERETRMLAIKREPRTVKEVDAEYPVQRVFLTDDNRASQLAKETISASFLILPVGNLFSNLKKNILKMDSRWKQ